MIALSNRSLLAVAAVIDVALNARPLPVSAKALAARHGLKARQLETILQALVRGAILKSVRGPRGGYELARERRRISVADIFRAAQPAVDPADGEAQASRLVAEVILPALAAAGEVYLRELEDVSVEKLCQTAGHDGTVARTVDFTI